MNHLLVWRNGCPLLDDNKIIKFLCLQFGPFMNTIVQPPSENVQLHHCLISLFSFPSWYLLYFFFPYVLEHISLFLVHVFFYRKIKENVIQWDSNQKGFKYEIKFKLKKKKIYIYILNKEVQICEARNVYTAILQKKKILYGTISIIN